MALKQTGMERTTMREQKLTSSFNIVEEEDNRIF
jgi:hypothetical protein